MSLARRALLLTSAFSVLSFMGCASMPTPTTIAATAAKAPELSTLSKLIQDAGLTETLSGTGPFTVFAPSDAAFKALPAKTLSDLAANPERLKAVLTYHVVAGRVPAAEVKNGNVKTVQGANIALAKAGTFVTVEDALVTQADIAATNGVIHVIDKVLIPPAR